MGTFIDGIYISEIVCSGDGSCAFSKFTMECIIDGGLGMFTSTCIDILPQHVSGSTVYLISV